MYVLLTLLSLYLLFAIVSGITVAYVTTHPDVNDFDKEKDELFRLGFDVDEFLKKFTLEDHICPSDDGYEINYSVIRQEDSKNTVVIAHGYCGNRLSLSPYVEMFSKLGFNCVIYDQRNHGRNEKNFTTMGFLESVDFFNVLNDSLKFLGTQEIIGFAGVSMGAATVLMVPNEKIKPDFIVSDSAYSSLEELIGHRIKSLKKPRCKLTLPICKLVLKTVYRIPEHKVSPLECVRKMEEDVPVIFVHSKCDDTVPYAMFEELYNGKNGIKESLVFDGQLHAKMIFNEPDVYFNAISEFLDKYVHKDKK